MMQKIVVFGKGGIGKSTIISNLAAVYARRGSRVLLVGCDPKHDTTVSLTEGKPIQTAVDVAGFMDLRAKKDQFVFKGRLGVDCVESGGPEPGIGCAGRGISRTIEMLESCGLMKEGAYDVILFDVLGDVVCGGFAAPLRLGFADKVVIIASEELMALYAANNIARAIKNYASNDIALCGIVANLKERTPKKQALERFARHIGTEVLTYLPRDPAVRKAEHERKTAAETDPESPFAKRLVYLSNVIWEMDPKKRSIPTPLTDEEFHEMARKGFAGERKAVAKLVTPAVAAAMERAGKTKDQLIEKMPTLDVPDDRLEKAIELWAKAAPAATGWVDGPHAMQWGEPDQWRNFYCDRESSRNYDQQVYLDAAIIGISHEDLECHYATPFFNDGYMTYHNFKWLQRREREDRFGSGCIGLTTDIRDSDVVQGGSKKLREALDIALEKQEGKDCILVTTTCVPTVIGDDATGIIEEYKAKAKIPILFSSPAAGQELNLLEYFFKRVRDTDEFRQERPQERTVNLIGFPWGKQREELRAMLEMVGIRVNLFCLPQFSVKDMKRFNRAALNVVYPDKDVLDIHENLFSEVDQKTLVPVAPFGLANCKRWLFDVARACGQQQAAEEAWEDGLREIGAQWDEQRERVKDRRLAFVADRDRVKRLSHPAGIAGVPLVSMLKEMGFGIDYLICLEGKETAPKVPKDGKHMVRFFKTKEDFRKLLSNGEFDAAYSEFFFDKRLTRAGKAQFSLLDIEMGVPGALRSITRLANVCHWKLYKRYGRSKTAAEAK